MTRRSGRNALDKRLATIRRNCENSMKTGQLKPEQVEPRMGWVAGVNQEVRSSDIHLGRLDGDECRCLAGQGWGSSGWLSLSLAD